MTSQRPSIVAIAPAFNEGRNIETLIRRFPPGAVNTVIVVSDGSSDDTVAKARQAGAHVIENARRTGCGPAIRTGLDFALQQGFDVAVVFAANGKDDPRQIGRLIQPILQEQADFVQGSRYLDGGRAVHMPLHRKIGTRLYSLLFSVLSRQRVTDGTNGFRAFRCAILKDPRINIWQDWLNNYEVESYLLFQSIRCGYRVIETGVSKEYPTGAPPGYTKMKPFLDWWSHFRPALLLALGIKR